MNGFGPLQVGGVENEVASPKISYTGFVGCIRDITDNGLMYDLFNPLKEVNAELGCKLNNPCPNCNDQGYCEPLWDKGICVCDLGFSGPTCSSSKRNWSFSSCFEPHHERKAKCKVFIIKISFQTKLILFSPKVISGQSQLSSCVIKTRFFLLGTQANWYKANSFTQYRVKTAKRKRRELVPPPVSMANEFFTNIALQVRVSPNSSDVTIFLASNSLGTEFNRIDVSKIWLS